jgi:FolB domain-containing protein
MTGKISIEDLEVRYRVGVPDQERAQPQRLLVSVEMWSDFTRAAASDDLAFTIDYGAVARRLLALGEGRSWRLLETLAVEVADLLRCEFGAAASRVVIKKFVIPQAQWVAVEARSEANRP